MEEYLIGLGYVTVREVPNRGWCAIDQMIYTYALLVGCDRYGYRTRFCYEFFQDALDALMSWDGTSDDPPGDWIVEKPVGRYGPGAKRQ